MLKSRRHHPPSPQPPRHLRRTCRTRGAAERGGRLSWRSRRLARRRRRRLPRRRRLLRRLPPRPPLRHLQLGGRPASIAACVWLGPAARRPLLPTDLRRPPRSEEVVAVAVVVQPPRSEEVVAVAVAVVVQPPRSEDGGAGGGGSRRGGGGGGCGGALGVDASAVDSGSASGASGDPVRAERSSTWLGVSATESINASMRSGPGSAKGGSGIAATEAASPAPAAASTVAGLGTPTSLAPAATPATLAAAAAAAATAASGMLSTSTSESAP